MVMVAENEPSADIMGGWTGFANADSDSANIIKMSKYPDCKKECEDDPECNNIRWTTKLSFSTIQGVLSLLPDSRCPKQTKTGSMGIKRIKKSKNLTGNRPEVGLRLISPDCRYQN